MVIGWLAAALTLLWCGLRVYERFAGENPIADTAYDLWLRQRQITDLDRACAMNPRRANVIVTLTTLPSRIGRIELTVKSLLRQTVSPALIRVNIPDRSRREDAPYRVPHWLTALRSVMINRCDDFGPATKLIPSLLDAAPGQRLLVVDDDRVYHSHFVEQMVARADANPGVAVAASGWDAPADLTDRPTTLLATLLGRPPAPIKCTRVGDRREIDVMQGFSGYLIEPQFFDRAEATDYSRAPAAAFFVDDVWISAHCRVPKVIVRGRRTNFPSLFDARFFKRSSVALVNRGTGSPATRNNTIMLRYFADRWRSRRSSDVRSRSATDQETTARACD